ncbi:NTF2- export protein 2, partial [Cladochytrium tenue]
QLAELEDAYAFAVPRGSVVGGGEGGGGGGEGMAAAEAAASKGAELFVRTFYKYYDSQRHNLHILYVDAAAVLWNGNPFAGIAAYKDFFLKLPATNHEVQSYDCQLVGDGASTNLLVGVSGIMQYGDAPHRPFSQTFVLVPTAADSGKKTYQVAADTFRFV